MNEPATTFDLAQARVCELIRRFQRYARDNYLQPGYQEAEARKAFIDPMLKALGRERRTVAALSETSWESAEQTVIPGRSGFCHARRDKPDDL